MSPASFAFVLCSLFVLASGQRWGIVKIGPSVVGSPSIFGWAYFDTTGATTSVTVEVSGLNTFSNTQLGIRIHQFADLVTNATTDAFEPGVGTFASHWQGGGSTAFGCADGGAFVFPNFRAGCLGNWNVDANGVINQTKTYPAVQISNGFYTEGDIVYSQSSPIGLGMLIHGQPDPCNGSTIFGSRIAGGVIGVFNAPSNPSTVARAYTSPASTVFTATCRFVGLSDNTIGGSNIRGEAWFRQNGATTSVRARLSNVVGGLGPDGARSMHVHNFGSLMDMASGISTGGHWNPNAAPHALPPQEPRHQGDLGRITIVNVSTGDLFYNYQLTSVVEPANFTYHPQLSGADSILGRGLILHAGQDVGCQAANSNGNAGIRAAACVIGLAPNSVWDNLDWNSIAPVEAQSIVPQPGDICTPPTSPPTSVSAPNSAPNGQGLAPSGQSVAPTNQPTAAPASLPPTGGNNQAPTKASVSNPSSDATTIFASFHAFAIVFMCLFATVL